ncbi:MAG: hypothetical protein RSB38_03070 [Oscillospiraceae bacterium]
MPFPHIEGASSDPSAILYGCGKEMFFISKETEKDVEVRDECINTIKSITILSNYNDGNFAGRERNKNIVSPYIQDVSMFSNGFANNVTAF